MCIQLAKGSSFQDLLNPQFPTILCPKSTFVFAVKDRYNNNKSILKISFPNLVSSYPHDPRSQQQHAPITIQQSPQASQFSKILSYNYNYNEHDPRITPTMFMITCTKYETTANTPLHLFRVYDYAHIIYYDFKSSYGSNGVHQESSRSICQNCLLINSRSNSTWMQTKSNLLTALNAQPFVNILGLSEISVIRTKLNLMFYSTQT